MVGPSPPVFVYIKKRYASWFIIIRSHLEGRVRRGTRVGGREHGEEARHVSSDPIPPPRPTAFEARPSLLRAVKADETILFDPGARQAGRAQCRLCVPERVLWCVSRPIAGPLRAPASLSAFPLPLGMSPLTRSLTLTFHTFIRSYVRQSASRASATSWSGRISRTCELTKRDASLHGPGPTLSTDASASTCLGFPFPGSWTTRTSSRCWRTWIFP